LQQDRTSPYSHTGVFIEIITDTYFTKSHSQQVLPNFKKKLKQ